MSGAGVAAQLVGESKDVGCRILPEVRLKDAGAYGLPQLERFCLEHQDIINSVMKGTVPRVDGHGAVEVLKIAEKAIRQIKK